MKNFTQIKHSEDLVGKTIERFIESDGRIFMHFQEDYFAVIENTGYEIRCCELMTDTFNFNTDSISNIWDLRDGGFLEEKEYNELRSNAEEKERNKKEDQQRRMYEELKAKFS